MERKINYLRSADRYLDGELGDQERQWFEKELLLNPDLAKDVELHREVNQAIRETDVMNFRNKLDEIHASIEPEYKQSTARKVMQSKYARIAAASVAILLSVGLFLSNMLNQPVNTDKLFQRYYEVPVLSGTVRSDAAVDKLFLDAVTHFNNEQFTDAATLFEQVVIIDRDNMKAHLAAGISNIEVNQTEKAERSFETVIDQKDNLYVDQANWFLALCYLKTKDLENAKMQFETISSDDRSFKHDEAKLILKKLDR